MKCFFWIKQDKQLEFQLCLNSIPIAVLEASGWGQKNDPVNPVTLVMGERARL